MDPATPTDAVDLIVEQWARERPDLDASPILVIGRLQHAADAVDAALRPPFAQAGLAPGDFDVLAALRRQGSPFGASPSALASATLVTQGATTKRVDRLEAHGLVTRTPSAQDGRGRDIRLTAAGLALVDRLIGVHLANESQILAALTPAERSTLTALLLRVTAGARDLPPTEGAR